jgi:hypothetical protein
MLPRKSNPFFAPNRLRRLACGAAVLLLSACDLTGSEAAEKLLAQKEADGKATGSACRNAGRAIEDCYTLNPKAPRAAVFAGWREMDEYMRENKLEAVAPTLSAAAKTPADAGKGDAEDPPARPPKSKAKAEH